jgi:uncharacterized protein (DUF433 family)
MIGMSRGGDEARGSPVTDLDWRDYIVSDERILAGKPIVKGTRLSVELVLELLAAGWDRDALRDSYPQLTEERIRAVLAYAAASFRDERFYLLPPVATSR